MQKDNLPDEPSVDLATELFSHPLSRGATEYGKAFGTLLEAERKRMGWSQKVLAEKISQLDPENKVSQQAVGHWEQGRMLPRPDKWSRLLRLLGDDSELARFARSATPTYQRKSSLMQYIAADASRASQSAQPTRHIDILDELVTMLPTKYQGCLARDVGQPEQRCSVHYLSKRMALELRRVNAPRWHMRDIHASLFNLLKVRQLLAPEEQPEVFILMLIGSQPNDLAAYRRAYDDARLFEVILEYRSSVDAVADAIKLAEEEGLDSLWEPDPDSAHDDY